MTVGLTPVEKKERPLNTYFAIMKVKGHNIGDVYMGNYKNQEILDVSSFDIFVKEQARKEKAEKVLSALEQIFKEMTK